MAIALVQKAPNTTAPAGGGKGMTVSFDSAPAAGNLITVCVTQNNNVDIATYVQSVVDNRGNTYTKAVEVFTGGTNHGAGFIWYVANCATGTPFTVTIDSDGAQGDYSVGLMEWSGAATSSPVGATNTGSGSGTSATTNAMNPARESVYLGVLTGDNVTFSTITPAQTEIHRVLANTTASFDSEYTETTGSQSLTWTTSNQVWIAAGAAFMTLAGLTVNAALCSANAAIPAPSTSIVYPGSVTVAITL